MPATLLVLVLIVLSVTAYAWARRSVVTMRDAGATLHSLPAFYGLYALALCGLPAMLMLAVWIGAEEWVVRQFLVAGLPPDLANLPADRLNLLISDIRNTAAGAGTPGSMTPAMMASVDRYLTLRGTSNLLMWILALLMAVAGALIARSHLSPDLRARNRVETLLNVILVAASTVAIFTTIGIVLSLIFEALRFFARYPLFDFLFGLTWSPQTAIRADQVGSTGSFGAIPLFAGTMLISAIAMLVAVPVGLLSAIYMSEFAPRSLRAVVKPVLEILAGIPTVVYGFFAALTVAPAVVSVAGVLGLAASAESALAAGLVMGVMIIPFMSSLSDDVINAVPNAMREGSYGLGATKAETITKVVLPAALPGIMAAFILALSRALGETMIVVMAAGIAANITANPLESATTVTVHISALLVGDQEFDSAKTLSAFALGLVLFLVTLGMNIAAQMIVKRYREQYE